MRLQVPIILTLTRLIISPLVLPLLLVYLLPFNQLWINGFLTILFMLFSVTDFFDGYFARRYKQETALGRLLDPIADKFLLYSTLVALLVADKIFFYWVIILIGREFFVMGLRLIALEYNITIAVSYLGKIKTAIYTFCLTLLILNPYQSLGLRGAPWWNGLEMLLVLLAIVISFLSAWMYYKIFIAHFKTRHITQEQNQFDHEDRW